MYLQPEVLHSFQAMVDMNWANLGLEVLLAQLVPPFLLVCLQPNAKPNCASQGNPVCQAKRAIELPAI